MREKNIFVTVTNDDLYIDENSGVFTKVTKTATKYDEIFFDDIRNKLTF